MLGHQVLVSLLIPSLLWRYESLLQQSVGDDGGLSWNTDMKHALYMECRAVVDYWHVAYGEGMHHLWYIASATMTLG